MIHGEMHIFLLIIVCLFDVVFFCCFSRTLLFIRKENKEEKSEHLSVVEKTEHTPLLK